MLSVAEILKATSGVFYEPACKGRIKGICINSRVLKKGDAFVAIVGQRHDGHAFVDAAIKQGASLVVISDKKYLPENFSSILVKDTTKALGHMASAYRMKFDIPVIAITGSAGKTTAKDMIAAVLSKKFKVLKTEKNENNQYGLPLTLFKLRKSHQAAVVEIGTNQPGDIPWLASIARPTVAVFTNIGESHLERLKTVGGVFNEKFKLVKFLAKDGVIIYNNDDVFLKKIQHKKLKQKRMAYGIRAHSLVQAKHIALTNSQVSFEVAGEKYVLKTLSQHNVYNALSSICCGRYFKIRYNEIHAALKRFGFSQNRQVMSKVGGVFLFDDTYNANPVSFRSAVATLNAFQVRGKKILVCGDMLELGKHSILLHQQLGEVIRLTSVHQVLTIGKFSKEITQVLKSDHKGKESRHFESLQRLNEHLKNVCAPGDAVLVKGSRGMQLEKVIEFMKTNIR